MEFLANLKEFANGISRGKVEIYNEASIQYELAIYLRNCFGEKYKIQLERNIVYFNLEKANFSKSEMDIVIYTPDRAENYCIELKFPTQGQYPEQMFKACRDIKFLEQLKDSGFKKCYFMMFADDYLFYSNKGGGEIYKMFRVEKIIRGDVRKPTGKEDRVLHLDGEYKIEWITLRNNLKYFVIEI